MSGNLIHLSYTFIVVSVCLLNTIKTILKVFESNRGNHSMFKEECCRACAMVFRLAWYEELPNLRKVFVWWLQDR